MLGKAKCPIIREISEVDRTVPLNRRIESQPTEGNLYYAMKIKDKSITATLVVALGIMVLAATTRIMLTQLTSELNVMSDPGYFRSDQAHHLVHGYGPRISKNLWSLHQALLQFCHAHNGRFPKMVNAADSRRALYPHFVLLESVFHNPNSQHLLEPNVQLSGRIRSSIRHPEGVISFYESDPPVRYPVVYYVTLDGNLHTVNSQEWSLAVAKSASIVSKGEG